MDTGYFSSQYTKPATASGADWSTWDTSKDGAWTEIAPFPLFFSENKSITSIGDRVFFVGVSATSGSGPVMLHHFSTSGNTVIQDRVQTQLAASSSWFHQENPRLIRISENNIVATYNSLKFKAINYSNGVATPGTETTYSFGSQRVVSLANLQTPDTFIAEGAGVLVKGTVSNGVITFSLIINSIPQSSTTLTDFATNGDLATNDKGLLVLTWDNHNSANYFIYTQGVGYGTKVTLTSTGAPSQTQEHLGVHHIVDNKYFFKYKNISQYPAATIVDAAAGTHSNQLVIENAVALDFTAFKLNDTQSFYVYRLGTGGVKGCVINTTGDPTLVSPIYSLGTGFATTNNQNIFGAHSLDDNRIVLIGSYDNKTYAKVLKV